MVRFLLTALALLVFVGLLRMGLAVSGLQEVSFFFQQTRIDVSLHFFFLCLLLAFLVFYSLLRLVFNLLALPKRARLWRAQQREKESLRTLQQAMMYFFAGRFVKAREALKPLLSYSNAHIAALLFSAEAAHAVQFESKRDAYVEQLEQRLKTLSSSEAQAWQEALLLSQARWALRGHDALGALAYLDALSQGAAHRTQSLRLRLRAAQAAGQTAQALETANKLIRHGAFSQAAAATLLQRLMLDVLQKTKNLAQLKQAWEDFDKKSHTQMPLICAYAERRLVLTEIPNYPEARAAVRAMLLPLLKDYGEFNASEREQLIQTLVMALPGIEPAVLQSIENLQQRFPAEPFLRYLSGVAAHSLGLWGKATRALQNTADFDSNSTIQSHAQNLLAQIPPSV